MNIFEKKVYFPKTSCFEGEDKKNKTALVKKKSYFKKFVQDLKKKIKKKEKRAFCVAGYYWKRRKKFQGD